MEVSTRRVLQKHLEPARPLRRFINVDTGEVFAPGYNVSVLSLSIHAIIQSPHIEPRINAATCAQALRVEMDQEVRYFRH